MLQVNTVALQLEISRKRNSRPLSAPLTCLHHARWETLCGPAGELLQRGPMEAGARVLLAAGSHVFVAYHLGNGVALGQLGAQRGQGLVLGGLEGVALQPFQFNAYGIVVAVGPALPGGLAGVPGALVAVHELEHLAAAADEVVRRHLQATDGLEVGVSVPVQRVGEQPFHLRPAILAGRQADGVHHDQADFGAGGAGAEVGGR